jgi:pilus assembly protein CpaE
MTVQPRSILLITPDPEISGPIGEALSRMPSVKVDTRASSLSALNGSAAKAAAGYDIVLFRQCRDDPAEAEAIRALAAAKRPGSVLVALADSDIALSEARALNRSGVDEVLPIGADPADFASQLVFLGHPRDAHAQGGKRGKVIAVTQARGGAGATTLAVNLADHLAYEKPFLKPARRASVALVDLDLQFGTIGSFLDIPDQDGLLRLALDGTLPDETFLNQSLVTTANGVSVLAAPSSFAPLDALRTEQVAAIIDTLRRSHDFVIVELPPALVAWIEPVLARADEVLVLTDLSVASVRHARRLIDFITTDHLTLPVSVIASGVARGSVSGSLRREAEKALERKILHWLPHDPKAARTAADRGKPLSASASGSSLNRSITKLTQAIRDRKSGAAATAIVRE